MSAAADLNGKVVLITGAGGGLGEVHARAAAASGATVAAPDLAAPLALRNLGAEHLLLAHDVSDRAAWDLVIEEAVRRFERIDGLVNNAGVYRYAPFVESTPALFEELLGVNLWGRHPRHAGGPAQHACRRLHREHRLGRGAVRLAERHGVLRLEVRAARAHPIGGGRTGARRRAGELLLPRRCGHPDALGGRARRPGAGRRPAIGRPGRPEEVSAMVVFRLGDGASYCTGQDFVVDAGMKA